MAYINSLPGLKAAFGVCRVSCFFFFWGGSCTLPETNIAPENGWLEYYWLSAFGKVTFQGRFVSFREGRKKTRDKNTPGNNRRDKKNT